ncbi:MAG: sugar ABC transporter permease, partial [Lachnospiraceae bacterium]|nr:sugar ABC transporter permease [Lachnospiraceae bacterium]
MSPRKKVPKKNQLSLPERIGKAFSNFGKRFADGSLGTKLSHFIFGAGNFYHKQYIKGLLFLLLQVGILAFMILCPSINGTPYGWKALKNLSLKYAVEGGDFDPATGAFTTGSDCKLMVLFGFVTIAVIVIYFLVWNMNIQSSYKADMDKKIGKKPTTFLEDLKELLDSKFHVLMLTPTCIAATIFTILPTIFMISLAFTTYNSNDMNELGTNLFHWNGIQNFRAVFTGEGSLGIEIKNRFLPVLGWTFIWAIFATLTCYFGGIILALLINKKGLKGKKLFRTIFILTIAIPQFISL